MDDRWYFAYGSNMQAATLRGRRGIEPLDVRIGRLAGYRLCFDLPIGGGSRGVFAFSGQLASGAFGVYMVDVDSMTIWCYEYQKERGCMRLAAARSWKYDRYLEQFNVCDITPADVERLIEDQRAYKQSDGDADK